MDNEEKMHKIFQSTCQGWQDYLGGKMGTDTFKHDCSCGCKYFWDGIGGIGDWGLCLNKESPRAGMLTWEHMGCPKFKLGNLPNLLALQKALGVNHG